MYSLDLCGWHVQSELPLPELPGWRRANRQPEGEQADVRVILAGDDLRFVARKQLTALLQCGEAGVCRLEVPGIADYYVGHGGQVSIRTDPGVDSRFSRTTQRTLQCQYP
jgi:hypothetical protein